MVLLVEDNDTLRRAFELMLRRDGYDVCAVDNGAAALAFLKTELPHCVVLDVSMPGMDGYEVLVAIRSEPAYAGVRVIMYSAHDGPMKDKGMALGADAFVVKGSLDWLKIKDELGRHCGQPNARGPSKPVIDDTARHVG